MDLPTFCRELPKIELHAHLNGSLSENTLRELKTLHLANGEKDKTNVFIDDFHIKIGDSRSLSDCFRAFSIAHSLTNSVEAVRLATRLTLAEFEQDGCLYVELRSTPRATGLMSMEQYLDGIVEEVRECSRHLCLISKVIVSVDRRSDADRASKTIDLAIRAHKQYPDIVVGVDLSGDPTAGKFEDFSPLLEKARSAGLKVVVHAAEVVNPTEVEQILAFKPERLGHAICVHPTRGGTDAVWRTLLDSKIPVEICLTSNMKSMSVNSYRDHHFKDLYAAGHPLTLATDDKGVFSTSLSEEYSICGRTFHLTCSQLWRISLNTVDYCFANELVKKSLRDKLLNFKNKHAL